MRKRFGRAVGVPGSPSALQRRQLVSQDPPNPLSPPPVAMDFSGSPRLCFLACKMQPSVTGGLSRSPGESCTVYVGTVALKELISFHPRCPGDKLIII